MMVVEVRTAAVDTRVVADDDMSDFTREEVEFDGKTRTVFRIGEGPAVIVIAEIPGITPKVLEFARRLPALGCTAVLPHLFGVPGRDSSLQQRGWPGYLWSVASSMGPACVSREFTVWALGKSSPVVGWLRQLAAREYQRYGGPGVGVVGMCFTGGYALAMAVDDIVVAPVLSQPSMPAPLTPSRRRSIDISPTDLARVKERCDDGLQVMGLRFCGDRAAPAERFAFLREQLGDAFIGIELDDAAANPAPPMPPHAVLTEHLIDEPGQPTRDALDRVLDFFATRLVTSA